MFAPRSRSRWLAATLYLSLFAQAARAQTTPQPSQLPSAAADGDAGVDGPPSAAPRDTLDNAAVPRGDTPVTTDEIVQQEGLRAAPTQAAAPPVPPKVGPPAKPEAPAAPLVIWATSEWGATLGHARCGRQGLEGAEAAIRTASTLKHSTATAGLGLAAAGALSDHPLLEYAARTQPERLAELIAAIGFKALAVGVSDMTGPLVREPRLADALTRAGVTVVASNLACAGAAYCRGWATQDDPLPIIERDGRRYGLISVLPDDLLTRVEPAVAIDFRLQPAHDALIARVEEARAAGVDLVVASMDHGPDTTTAVNLAHFVTGLPVARRPDLMFSPSSGDHMLFLRPLDVLPAIVGTRRGVLTGVRVTKLPDGRDADVLARSVLLSHWDDQLAALITSLGDGYCRERAQELPGGKLASPVTHEDFVALAGAAVRELAVADLALVDPFAYEPAFAKPEPSRLQLGETERAVLFDSPLVVASVSLPWLADLNKVLNGPRPLVLIGATRERGDDLIAGRIPVTGATYRLATTAVLARSGRLPPGVSWSALDAPHATLRGALLAHLNVDSPEDPRPRLRDPVFGTQWVMRADGQLQANLTAIQDGRPYSDEPALQVNASRQLGGRLLLNLDADAPDFLFENVANIALDRNFATDTTAQDLIILQTTYTYRGLWPRPLWYPDPFVEGYIETEFFREQAPYHHLLLRPRLGLRSFISRVLSFKVSGGVQDEVFDPNSKILGGVGAELLLKPWTVPLSNGTMQLEGNIIYYWNAPGTRDEQTLRGQVVSSFQLFGPLQVTLSALAVARKDPHTTLGKGLSIQAGIRVRLVTRDMVD